MMERYYFSSLIFAALVATAICDNPTENDSRLSGGEVAGVVFVGLFVYGFVMGIVYVTFLQSKSPDIEEEMQVDDEEMVLAKKTSTEEAPTDQKIPEEKADEPAPVKVEKKARPISTAIVQEAVEDMRMQLQERQDSDMNFYLSGFEDEATGDPVEAVASEDYYGAQDGEEGEEVDEEEDEPEEKEDEAEGGSEKKLEAVEETPTEEAAANEVEESAVVEDETTADETPAAVTSDEVETPAEVEETPAEEVTPTDEEEPTAEESPAEEEAPAEVEETPIEEEEPTAEETAGEEEIETPVEKEEEEEPVVEGKEEEAPAVEEEDAVVEEPVTPAVIAAAPIETEETPATPMYLECQLNKNVLSVRNNNSEPGAQVWVIRKNNTPGQQWILTEDGYLQSALNGLVLEIQDENTDIKADLQTGEKRGAPAQKWQLVDGYVQSELNGMVLAVVGGMSGVCMYTKNNTDNQKWVFVAP